MHAVVSLCAKLPSALLLVSLSRDQRGKIPLFLISTEILTIDHYNLWIFLATTRLSSLTHKELLSREKVQKEDFNPVWTLESPVVTFQGIAWALPSRY